MKEGWRCEPEEGRIEKRERIGGERDGERSEADEAGGLGKERREVDKKEEVEPMREGDKKERVEPVRRTSAPLEKAEGKGREQDQIEKEVGTRAGGADGVDGAGGARGACPGSGGAGGGDMTIESPSKKEATESDRIGKIEQPMSDKLDSPVKKFSDPPARLDDDHPTHLLEEEEPHQGQQKAAGLQLPLVS